MPARILAAGLFVALLAGCSSAPPQKADPVDVVITVTLPSGQPARDVTLNVFPTTPDQIQGGGKTDAKGQTPARLVPGKYTFSIEGAPAALTGVPQKYQSNSQSNALEVTTGVKDVALKLTN